ncbi:MFS transporter [Streptomyces sp. B-S-A8]|uniref:MFS transporter n=1 Tax=Streptomyces solicavernae TaxID=3043614 RepID=A0ABT6RTB7_9ACTN|nr:MFS transporter [Streptomyces sp. B-S-A8]MDI3387585.1 MFS transporter [Streptomyces sp. B-S-A8]
MPAVPLRNRTYRRLFTAQVVALVGTGLATVALGLLAYDLAGEDASAVLGTALAIKMVAYVTVAPLVDAVAHRIPRRTLLVATDLARATVALALPFVTQIWQVYVLILLLQAASAAFTPTFQAALPAVLPDERDYTRALSLSRLAYDLESLFSPALAAGLLSLVSYDWLFAGTSAGFLASAALVVSCVLPPPSARADGPRGSVRRATCGIRLFCATPRLRALLALDLAVAAAGAMVIVHTVVLVRHDLGRSAGAVSVALAAYGAGSMAVALLLPRVLDRVGDRAVMLPAAFALPAVFTAYGLATLGGPSWPALLTAWCAFGAASSALLTPTGRLLRRSTPPSGLPAAFAAQFSLSHACWLLTYPLAGWVGASAGAGVAGWVLGAVALTGAVAATWLWPSGDAVSSGPPSVPSAGGAPAPSGLALKRRPG